MLVPSIFATDLIENDVEDFFRHRRKDHEQDKIPMFMRTDIIEVGENYRMEVELPGYRKEELHAELINGYLTISASVKKEIDDKQVTPKYVHQERYKGNCKRSFYVGEGLKQEDIKASFVDGVLILVFPTEKHRLKIAEKKYIPIE